MSSLTGLQSLILSGNPISLQNSTQDVTLCTYMKQLHHISLSKCEITELPRSMFSECIFLAEVHLDFNHLKVLSLPALPHLAFVGVSSNLISNFEETTISTLHANKHSLFDFQKNQFICDCSKNGKVFVNLLQTSDYKFIQKQNYTCNFRSNTTQKILEIHGNYCNLYTRPIAYSVACILAVFFVVFVFVWIYKRKYKLYYRYQL